MFKGNFNIVLCQILDIFYNIFNNYKIKERVFEERAVIIREHTNDLLSDDNIIMTELLKMLFQNLIYMLMILVKKY